MKLVDFIAYIAEKAGFIVEKYYSGIEFVKHYQGDSDIIMLDLMMPDIDGVEVIRYLAKSHCTAQLVLISGFDKSVLHSAQELAKEQNLNFAGCLNKPFRAEQLNEFLTSLKITPRATRENSPQQPVTTEEIIDAISNHQFVMHFQPKICFDQPNLLTVEALVRWEHPQRGLLGPDLFIPRAEEENLIDDLTWEIFDLVLTQAKDWLSLDLNVKIAVNMSAITLKDLELPKKMTTLLQEYHLEPSQIVLEVTESALMTELITSLDILTRLRMKGFELSIDDFGTGYSSLLQLHRIPFSEIKIDRSFVNSLNDDPESLAIVETVVLLGHKLGMNVVAEGVETQSCLDKLKMVHCDVVQGYFICKPKSAEEITRWFHAKKYIQFTDDIKKLKQ